MPPASGYSHLRNNSEVCDLHNSAITSDHIVTTKTVAKAPRQAGPPVLEYEPGTWGLEAASQQVAPPGGWLDPAVNREAAEALRRLAA